MKRDYRILICSFLLMILLVVAAYQPPSAEADFSCHTFDAEGRILKGHWSESDGTWYLFVTSVQDVAELELHYTGAVTETTAGRLTERLVTGGFQNSGDELVLTQADGTTQKVVVLQSSIPSVYVNLERTTLAAIHADKNTKHPGNSVYIMDPAGTYDLSVMGTVEIKGRGNSSWREYEKKGYQLKFDYKTSVLGMAEAEKWVLLANASDDSLMRNQIASRLAKKLDMAFAASFGYVDLWMDGEYLGTYLLGEKVEPGSSRLNLENLSGALFEHDVEFYQEEEYRFVSKTLNRPFVLKEIVDERWTRIRPALTNFEASVDALMQYLYRTPSEKVTLADLSQMIDVDSFVKYYLINEYTLNRESFATSFFWYQDGPEDVLHLGPVWDFDTSMGNDGEPNTAYYGDNHVMFRYLMASPAFYERTIQLLEVYRDALEQMKEDVDILRDQISRSAQMNYLRWNVLGKPNPKGGTAFAPTFDAAADTLKQWLSGREREFWIMRSNVATSVVSDDCSTMTVCVYPEAAYGSVMVALWSDADGQDDVIWYPAQPAEDGTWQCTVDLAKHNCAGIYYYDVYGDDQSSPMATGRNYVRTATAPLYDLKPELVEETAQLVVRLDDATGTLTSVWFDVWGATVHNTSYHRLKAEQSEQGTWVASAPLCGFDLPGPDHLLVYAYGVEQNATVKLNERQMFVETPPAHTYPAGEGGICSVCGDEPGVKEFLAKVPVYCLRVPETGAYFYTTNETERDALLAGNWQDEGISWYAPVFGGEPVYRLVNPAAGSHYFAKDSAEAALLTEAGWTLEGNCWNSHAGGEPVYRMRSPQELYFYTADEAQRDSLEELGWTCEGIVWYGAPAYLTASP